MNFHSLIYKAFPNRAYPIHEIPAKSVQGAAIIHMILNNLDKRVAQFPEELVTYGGNGQCLANWAQVNIDNIKLISKLSIQRFQNSLQI